MGSNIQNNFDIIKAGALKFDLVANKFLKRAIDIVGASVLYAITKPKVNRYIKRIEAECPNEDPIYTQIRQFQYGEPRPFEKLRSMTGEPTPGIPDSCLLYTSPSPRDQRGSRMPSSA